MRKSFASTDKIVFVVRYLLIGIWNTAFGYGVYALLTFLFSKYVSHGYLFASLLAGLISVSVSFLGYRKVVFKSNANFYNEWRRSLVLYGASISLGTVSLVPIVYLVTFLSGSSQSAPYVAGLVVIVVQFIFTGVGNVLYVFNKRT
jgi:putative flippase GtrA